MANKYSIQFATDFIAWDEFVERSPQGTIFSTNKYLRNIRRKIQYIYILVGKDIRAGLVLIERSDGGGYELDDLVIYNGFFFEKPNPNQKINGIYSEQFSLISFTIQELFSRYPSISISLSPEIIDVRPFLWHNYFSEDPSEKYRIDLRYTSFMNIQDLASGLPEEETDLYMNLDMKRRQSIRKARKLLSLVKESDDSSLLINFYKETISRQGKMVENDKIENMRKVIEDSIKSKYGKLFIAYNENNIPASVSHFIFDSKRAYYLFGASNLQNQDDYCGTVVLWDAFKELAKMGMTVVDMEGINSPKRGWFKLSFGGDIRPYYEIRYGVKGI